MCIFYIYKKKNKKKNKKTVFPLDCHDPKWFRGWLGFSFSSVLLPPLGFGTHFRSVSLYTQIELLQRFLKEI